MPLLAVPKIVGPDVGFDRAADPDSRCVGNLPKKIVIGHARIGGGIGNHIGGSGPLITKRSESDGIHTDLTEYPQLVCGDLRPVAVSATMDVGMVDATKEVRGKQRPGGVGFSVDCPGDGEAEQERGENPNWSTRRRAKRCAHAVCSSSSFNSDSDAAIPSLS